MEATTLSPALQPIPQINFRNRDGTHTLLSPFNSYKMLVAKEEKRHKRAVAKLGDRLKTHQLTCKHEHTQHYPDPAQPRDSWTECQDCGKDLG